MIGKYKPYPEYKDSEIEWLGAVPSHWKVCRIKNVATINPSKSEIRGLPADSKVSFIPMEAIGERGELDASRVKTLSAVLTGYTYVADGDIMIAKITPCFENGKGAIAKNLTNGIGFATTEVIPIRPELSLDTGFLFYVLNCNPFKFIAESSMYGAGGQKRVADSFVAKYHLSFPPKSERVQIANFLDYETTKIDTLIEQQQQLIQLLKEKRQTVISHSVTKGLNPNAKMRASGIDWLGQIPNEWTVTKIKYIAELTPKKSEIEKNKDMVCSFIPMEKLKADLLILDETRLIEEVFDGYTYFRNEDILMAKVTPCFENKNMVVARGLVNGVGFGSSEIYVLRAKVTSLNDFLYYRLQEDVFMEIAAGAMTGAGGLKRVPSEFLNNFQIALPPKAERLEIVEYIRDYTRKFDTLVEKAQSAIGLMQERRTALISAAVTGKIDVRSWGVPQASQTNKEVAA